MISFKKGRNRNERGGVTVEAALLTPLLITLLFGIIEFGLIFKDLLLIHQAAREGARVAAVGASTYEIGDRVMESAPTLATENLAVQLQYRTYDGGWSSWATLGNWGSENDAPANAQVRVQITYDHPLACGPLFARFFGDPGNNTIQLTTGMVMCREE